MHTFPIAGITVDEKPVYKQADIRVCSSPECDKKLSSLNAETTCFSCQEKAQRKRLGLDVALPPTRIHAPGAAPCSRGCGKVQHKGKCVGEQRHKKPPVLKALPPAFPVEIIEGPELATPVHEFTISTAPLKQIKDRLDALGIEVVAQAVVPEKRPRKSGGRMGTIWTALDALGFRANRTLKIPSRNIKHANATTAYLIREAKKRNMVLDVVRNETTVYVKLVSFA